MSQCDWPDCQSQDANVSNERGSWLCMKHLNFVEDLKRWILLGTGINGL